MSSSIVVLLFIFVFIYLMTRLANQEKERKQRTHFLEQAMKNDRLSPGDLAEIIKTLRPKDSLFSYENLIQGRTVFVIGWIAIFVGVGVSLNHYDTMRTGLFIAICGLGLVTLPAALREFEARRQA